MLSIEDLARPEAAVVLGVWAIMEAIRRAFPAFYASPLFARVQIPLVLALGGGLIWLPFPGVTYAPALRTMLGVLLAALSGMLVKGYKQTFLGQDPRIAPAVPPPEAP